MRFYLFFFTKTHFSLTFCFSLYLLVPASDGLCLQRQNRGITNKTSTGKEHHISAVSNQPQFRRQACLRGNGVLFIVEKE